MTCLPNAIGTRSQTPKKALSISHNPVLSALPLVYIELAGTKGYLGPSQSKFSMTEVPDQPHVNGTSPSTTEDEDSTTIESPSKHRRNASDPDAQEMVIASLRTQIQDLFSQVNELNNKLVKSYDRVSDLEDDIHVASANLRTSSLRISQLELERTQHLAALNTGLLVEKSHVTTELNRLMEKATEEAAQRGQAESARMAIEKDLDDLSATLFHQANTMVAEARYAQHLSEQKVAQAQQALKGAEEAVGIMQNQMQSLEAEKEEAENKAQEFRIAMGKGKWVDRRPTEDLSRPLKLLSSHLPYQDFLLFVAHLRSLRQTSPNPPAMATILPLPFLARLLTEDSEPTVRLDLAPSLNWLSRRSVLAAIHTGQLTIEPIPVSALFSESALYSSPMTVAGISSGNDSVSCALCGMAISVAAEHLQGRSHPPQRPSSISLTNQYSWSGSLFKKTANRTTSNGSRPPSPTQSASPMHLPIPASRDGVQQVYVFRLTSQSSSSMPSLPIPSIAKSLSQGAGSSSSAMTNSPSNYATPNGSSPNNQTITIYPLCSSGWCLRRLRTTCTLWSFVRTGIVEKIWEEEVPFVPPPAPVPAAKSTEKPALPPRKRGLWGLASAIGERAASWSDSDKDKKNSPVPPPAATASSSTVPSTSTPPPLPPRRATLGRRLPPPPPPEINATPTPLAATPPPPAAAVGTPPPLPKRSEVRKPLSTPAKGEKAEGEATPADYSSPTKLLFDAAAPHSPPRPTRPTPPLNGGQDLPQRTSTPSNVPLPDSRPASPWMNGGSGAAPERPARIASPATVLGGPSAVPPPIPRRAAARRPVPAFESASRPATPVQPERKPEEGVEEKPAKTVDEEREGETVPANGPTPAAADAETKPADATVGDATATELGDKKASEDVKGGDEGIEQGEKPAGAERSGEESEDEFVDAPSVVAIKEDLGTETPALQEEAVVSEDATPAEVTAPAIAASSPKEGNVPDVEVTEEVRVAADGNPNEAQQESKTHETGDASTKDSGEVTKDEKEVYIGDTTWEERSWKELVKLREEMFWARIGGSR